MSSRCDSREKTKGGGTRGSATTCSFAFQPSRNANTRCVYNRLVVPPRFQRFELPERKASKRFLASKWRDRKRDRERVSTSLFEKEILRAESSATTIPAIENFAFVAIVSLPILDSRDIASIDSFWPNCRVIYWIFCRGGRGRKRRNFLEIGNSMTREKFSFPRVTKVISIRSWYEWKKKKEKEKERSPRERADSSSPTSIRFNPSVKINSAVGNSVFPIVTSRYLSSISVATKRETVCNAMLLPRSPLGEWKRKKKRKEKGIRKMKSLTLKVDPRWPMISLI